MAAKIAVIRTEQRTRKQEFIVVPPQHDVPYVEEVYILAGASRGRCTAQSEISPLPIPLAIAGANAQAREAFIGASSRGGRAAGRGRGLRFRTHLSSANGRSHENFITSLQLL
jgi:hypothetical protein